MAEDEEYERALQKAESCDLTLVRGRRIVELARTVDGSLATDSEGCNIVILTPALVPDDPTAWEKAFDLFLVETKEICETQYRVVLLNSGFTAPLWFLSWLIRHRAMLSRGHKKNIVGVSVVHPSFKVRVIGMGLRLVLSYKFWEKLHYADRIEELWLDEVIDEDIVKNNVPRSAWEFEGHVIEEAKHLRQAGYLMGVAGDSGQ